MRYGWLIFLLLALAPAAWGGACPTSFAKLQKNYRRLPQPPLEVLVHAAGFSLVQLELLQKNAKAVVGIEDFLKIRQGLGPGYLLAKDGVNYTDQIFSSRLGLRHWIDGYDRVGMRMRWKDPDPIHHTPEFLTKITDSGEPIVFLIPPGILPGTAGFTRAELRWALEHPERLANMTFVFGAYDFLPREFLDEFNRERNYDELRKLLTP